jgi:hypothetical protein
VDRLRPSQILAEHENDRQRLSALAVIYYYFPDRQDFLMGDSWAGVLVAPIPRWIWPDKMKNQRWRETAIIYELVGAPTPVPLHGLFYANFSWIGVVLGMFAWGVSQRGIYEWLRASGYERNSVLIYCSLGMYFAPSLLAISSMMQWVLPTWLILRFIGRRRAAARLQEPSGNAVPVVT